MLKEIKNNGIYYLSRDLKITKDVNGKTKQICIPKGYAVQVTKSDTKNNVYTLKSAKKKVENIFGEKMLLEILVEGFSLVSTII